MAHSLPHRDIFLEETPTHIPISQYARTPRGTKLYPYVGGGDLTPSVSNGSGVEGGGGLCWRLPGRGGGMTPLSHRSPYQPLAKSSHRMETDGGGRIKNLLTGSQLVVWLQGEGVYLPQSLAERRGGGYWGWGSHNTLPDTTCRNPTPLSPPHLQGTYLYHSATFRGGFFCIRVIHGWG